MSMTGEIHQRNTWANILKQQSIIHQSQLSNSLCSDLLCFGIWQDSSPCLFLLQFAAVYFKGSLKLSYQIKKRSVPWISDHVHAQLAIRAKLQQMLDSGTRNQKARHSLGVLHTCLQFAQLIYFINVCLLHLPRTHRSKMAQYSLDEKSNAPQSPFRCFVWNKFCFFNWGIVICLSDRISLKDQFWSQFPNGWVLDWLALTKSRHWWDHTLKWSM